MNILHKVKMHGLKKGKLVVQLYSSDMRSLILRIL